MGRRRVQWSSCLKCEAESERAKQKQSRVERTKKKKHTHPKDGRMWRNIRGQEEDKTGGMGV